VPEGRLLLTGTGPEEQALRAQVAAAGLEDRVHFAGAVSDADLPAYYRAADVYVLPAVARSEAFGLSMVEAQASGLPCISTELGTGTSYVNVNGVTGLVVPPADAGALAQALRHLLADDDVRRAMGWRAQARAADLFDIDAHTAAIAAIYRDVTLPPGSP
jgi:rhamnosyl/mannosyltransferase